MLKEISIEIIRKCPNHCLHCSSLSSRECVEVMPYEKFYEVIADASELGAKTICLSGGEPFLHSKIVDMVKLVNEYGMSCYIYTSGIVINAQNELAPVAKEILEQIAGYDAKLIFNIEAGTEHAYDKIMGTKNCFGKMKEAALRAADIGLYTEAHFVPMAINADEIQAVLMLCEELHISKLSFLRLVLHGRAKQNKDVIELTYEKEKKLKEKLSEIKAKAGISVRVGVPLSLDTACHKCEAANGKLNIKYDGEVYPCEVFKNYSMEKSMGNLKPDNIYQSSLVEIYGNSKYLRYVRELSSDFLNIDSDETCIGQYLMKSEG